MSSLVADLTIGDIIGLYRANKAIMWITIIYDYGVVGSDELRCEWGEAVYLLECIEKSDLQYVVLKDYTVVQLGADESICVMRYHDNPLAKV